MVISFTGRGVGVARIIEGSDNRRSMNLELLGDYEGWNFNSGNYLFTTDTK